MTHARAIRLSLFALLGLFAIGAFWLLVHNTSLFSYFHFPASRAVLFEDSYERAERGPFGGALDSLDRSVSIHFDSAILRHLQLAGVAPARETALARQVSVSYRRERDSDHTVFLDLTYYYDALGRLAGYSMEGVQTGDSLRLPEAEARELARTTLAEQVDDTTGFGRPGIEQGLDKGRQRFTFAWQRPLPELAALRHQVTVTMTGSAVTGVRHRLERDPDNPAISGDTTLAMKIAIGVVVVLWLVGSVFLLVRIVERERRAAMGHNFVMGIAIFAVMTLQVAVDAYPEWLGMLLGGVLAGVVVGGTAMLLCSIAETLAREVWPEKMALADLLGQGQWRFRELGEALLRGLGIGGLAVLGLGMVLWMGWSTGIGFLSLEGEDFWLIRENGRILSELFGLLISTVFMSYFVQMALPSLLRGWIERRAVLGAVLAVLLPTMMLTLLWVRPPWLMLLFSLPLGAIWAWLILRENHVTMLIAMAVAVIGIRLFEVGLLPGAFGHPALIGFGMLFALLFLTGVILAFSRRTIADFAIPVPEYIRRFRERERIQSELEIARTIQFRFLPERVPVVAGLEVASMCRPAMEVGGDYYDFVRHDDGTLGVIIGDVSGKGISAAFYMTMIKGIVKTVARHSADPAAILREVNRVFFENTPRNIFVSMLYGRFDLERGEVRFARAGHNPLLVRKRAGGEPMLFTPPGIAIGMDEGARFDRVIAEERLPLEAGDLFVFYTDGITEAMNDRGEEYGEARLQAVIQGYGDENADTVLGDLDERVRRFAGQTPQHDDITLVVVRVGT